jgi:aminopeptidase N
MKIKVVVFFLSAITVFYSCKSKKEVASNTQEEPSIQLDTVRVVANPSPEKKVYRASNTRSNDLLHTKLEVSFDWQKSYLFGKATLTLKPYFYSTDKLFLNARGMEIKEVALLEMNGDKQTGKKTLKYVYANDSLKIELDKEYKSTETYIVFVDYVAKPDELKALGGSRAISSDKGLYFINPKGEDKSKMPQIWTQGETQSNQVWFPTIDSPNERMTEEILITVDNKYTTLSNGDLVSQKNNADGTRTDHWKMNLPHAPYLVMMGIGEFKVVKDSWKGKPVNYYVEKEYEPHAKAIFGKTPEMIEFFSNKLGYPYAWSKYSQIVVRDYVSKHHCHCTWRFCISNGKRNVGWQFRGRCDCP